MKEKLKKNLIQITYAVLAALACLLYTSDAADD